LEEYVERFKELKSLVNSLNPSLPKSYYVFDFINRLREDIKPMLKILRLATLIQTFEQAKWQEESNDAMSKRSLFSLRIVLSCSID
jgi:hypothetical protein